MDLDIAFLNGCSIWGSRRAGSGTMFEFPQPRICGDAISGATSRCRSLQRAFSRGGFLRVCSGQSTRAFDGSWQRGARWDLFVMEKLGVGWGSFLNFGIWYFLIEKFWTVPVCEGEVSKLFKNSLDRIWDDVEVRDFEDAWWLSGCVLWDLVLFFCTWERVRLNTW